MVAGEEPCLFTSKNLIQRTNRWTSIGVPLTVTSRDVVKLPNHYRDLFETYLLPHWLRAGCERLRCIEWEWTDPTSNVTMHYPQHRTENECVWGVELAKRIVLENGLYNVAERQEYVILPLSTRAKSWFSRVQMLTQNLRWSAGRVWPPVGVLITNIVTYHPDGPVNLAGVLLSGSRAERQLLCRNWLAYFGHDETYTPPVLGPGWD